MDKNRVSLIIKTTKGESCDISVPEDSTIEELKCLISLKFDIPVENQRLIHSGRILDDEKTIDDYSMYYDIIYFPHEFFFDNLHRTCGWATSPLIQNT